jgi:hypothetical protein
MIIVKKSVCKLNVKTLILSIIGFFPLLMSAQPGTRITIGLHADPLISWFGSDINKVSNEGSRPGFNFGFSINKYFGPNYSFSSGINLISAGGRLISNDVTIFKLDKYESETVTVSAGEAIVYKVQYLSVPLGLKLQTNQIGYMTFFSDFGLDPKVVIGGKADIPSLDLKGETTTSELNIFNLSYHIIAGIEYSLGGSTAAVLGLGFENNFLDITKDNGDQPDDKTTHKLLSFRLGIIF